MSTDKTTSAIKTLNKTIEETGKKPLFPAYRLLVADMVGLGVSSTVVARGYELLQPDKNDHMVKRGIELSKAGYLDRDLLPHEGVSMIREIADKFHTCTLYGVNITNEQALIALTAFACELFMDKIKISPNVLLYGVSRSGKSFLSNILTQLRNTATLPPDASGIGKFSLSVTQRCLRVEDAEMNFFRNSTNTQLIKSAFHQQSSITEPGKSVPICSTAFLITTNVINPFENIKCDEVAMKRRFLEIYFDTEYDPDIDQCDLNKRNEIIHELVKNIANRNPLNTEFNIECSAPNKNNVKRALKKMLKLVHKFAEDQLILTHNMAEELAFEKELVEISELAETDFDSAGDSYNMEI